jgi:hypothetical protein
MHHCIPVDKLDQNKLISFLKILYMYAASIPACTEPVFVNLLRGPVLELLSCRGLVVVVVPASAEVVVPNSQQTSCLDGSFLECSLPAREARIRSPAGTYQSWDL